MDTKSKEPLGRLFGKRKVYCTKAQEAYDHNDDSLIIGKIIPHGLYDIKKNKAYINIGTSNETAKFLCDSIKNCWENLEKLVTQKQRKYLFYAMRAELILGEYMFLK